MDLHLIWRKDDDAPLAQELRMYLSSHREVIAAQSLYDATQGRD